MKHFISTVGFSAILEESRKRQELESIKCLIKTGNYYTYHELRRLSEKKRQLESELRTLRALPCIASKKRLRVILRHVIKQYGHSLCRLLKRGSRNNSQRS